jgi:hypothetical protein
LSSHTPVISQAKKLGENEFDQKARSTNQNMPSMQSAFQLAKEMGKRLEGSEVL